MTIYVRFYYLRENITPEKKFKLKDLLFIFRNDIYLHVSRQSHVIP